MLFAPDSDEALYYLAQSYIHDNNESQGRMLLNQLITKFPDSRYAQRAGEYLSSGVETAEPTETAEGDAD